MPSAKEMTATRVTKGVFQSVLKARRRLGITLFDDARPPNVARKKKCPPNLQIDKETHSPIHRDLQSAEREPERSCQTLCGSSPMQLPEGVNGVGRWHSADGNIGWNIVEADGPKTLATGSSTGPTFLLVRSRRSSPMTSSATCYKNTHSRRVRDVCSRQARFR